MNLTQRCFNVEFVEHPVQWHQIHPKKLYVIYTVIRTNTPMIHGDVALSASTVTVNKR